MKIALVSPYDYSYPGGVVRHISSLESCFTRMGHTVKIIAPASKPVNDYGDRFIPIGKPRPIPTSGSIARITISLNLANQVKEVLEREKFDIIHLHEPLVPALPLTILRHSQAINVGTFHAYHGPSSWAYFYTRPILKRWFRKLHGKLAVSKPAMTFVCRYFPGYYTIIPNGVDVDHFSTPVPPIEAFADGKQNVLFVGRLEKRKGLKYLLAAFHHVQRHFPMTRLIVVGPDGGQREECERLVAHNGVRDVVFVGYVHYGELPRYYGTADIFCAPSTGLESFGIVLLEAMAAAKPIVASNIDGYASVVSQGDEGLLVEPKDEDALADALMRLLADKGLREEMGARGRKKAEEHSWPRIAERVMDYYQRLLQDNRPR